MDENEDDNQLLLIITHLETHGLPVGNGIYKEVKEKNQAECGDDDDTAQIESSPPGTDVTESMNGASDVDQVWSFPYVKCILGDQKAASNYFVSLPEPPEHEHREKYLNQHHKTR